MEFWAFGNYLDKGSASDSWFGVLGFGKVFGAPVTFGWSSGLLEITLTEGAPATLGLEFWAFGKVFRAPVTFGWSSGLLASTLETGTRGSRAEPQALANYSHVRALWTCD